MADKSFELEMRRSIKNTLCSMCIKDLKFNINNILADDKSDSKIKFLNSLVSIITELKSLDTSVFLEDDGFITDMSTVITQLIFETILLGNPKLCLLLSIACSEHSFSMLKATSEKDFLDKEVDEALDATKDIKNQLEAIFNSAKKI